MVLDHLNYSEKYESLHPNFAAAFSFLKREDLALLAPGKYEIIGKDVYASVQEYCAKEEENARYEAHQAYIDIQFLVSGSEKMIFGNQSRFSKVGEYSQEKDVCFYEEGENTATFPVCAGEFAIFFPQDVHKPGVYLNESSSRVKKVVVKVRILPEN